MNLKVRNGVKKDNSLAHFDGSKPKVSWDASLPFPRVPTPLSVILVGAAGVVCYISSLDGGFVFDDSEAIVNNEDLKPETPISNLLFNDFWGTRLTLNTSHKSYRPLTVLSFRWNYWLAGGLFPRGFHLTNVTLHAAVSMLSLAVFNLLLGGGCPRASLLAALLFAVHPIHAEAVAGVVGRADLLCALFYFLSFIAYCNSVHVQWGMNQLFTLLLSMFLCATAMFCKEQGITVIGLCSVYDIIVNSKIHPLVILRLVRTYIKPRKKSKSPSPSRTRSGSLSINCDSSMILNNIFKEYDHQSLLDGSEEFDLRPLLYRHTVLLVSGLFLLVVRWRMMASAAPTFQTVDNPASFADSIITRVLSYNYIYSINGWLLLCPEWLCFDWSMGCIPLVESLEPRLVAPGLFWLILGLLIWRSLCFSNGKHERNLAMCLATMIIPFLPASNLFFRVGFVIAERVLYLPSVGFCLLVIVGLRQLASLRKVCWVLQLSYMSMIVILAVRAIWRSSDWKSEGQLFRSGLSVCPLNAKVHYNIAKNAGDLGNRTLAVFEYREALRLHPEYDQAMNNLANILKDEGKLQEAEILLRRAVQLRPEFAAAWMNLGIVLAGLKRHREAESSYFTALVHRNKYPDCYYNLGNLYLDQQQYDKAYRAWRNATALKPTHTVAWSNMIIMLDNIGEAERAEMVAQEALSILPMEPSLHFNLANTLGKAGRFAEAEKHFIEAIGLDVKNPMYYTNLGVLYHRWKKYDKAERLYRQALELNPKLRSAKDNMALLEKAKIRMAGNRN